jgi:hypothetical protein
MASTSPDYQKRIVELIDLHLGKLAKSMSDIKTDDGLSGFNIGEYI